MFCSKCGTQLADTCAFCSRCGAPTQPANQTTPNNYVNQTQTVNQTNTNLGTSIIPKQFTLETDTIIAIVISVIMILSTSLLPMLKTGCDSLFDSGSRVIRLLEDFSSKTFSDGDVIFGKLTFIIIVASLIALVFFKITKKQQLFSIVSAFTSLGMVVFFDFYIIIRRAIEVESFDLVYVQPAIGSFVCVLCAIALLYLTGKEFFTAHFVKKGPPPVITYAPGYKP